MLVKAEDLSKSKTAQGKIVDLEHKRQFVFDFVSALGWQAYNEVNRPDFVFCTDGTRTFYVRLKAYDIPAHQVEIAGSWPLSKIPKDRHYRYYPRNSVTIRCSAKKKTEVAARDIKKRFLTWFIEEHDKQMAIREDHHNKWILKEHTLAHMAEAVDADRIQRGNGQRPIYDVAEEMILKGDMKIGKNYSGEWFLGVTKLTSNQATDIANLIQNYLETTNIKEKK